MTANMAGKRSDTACSLEIKPEIIRGKCGTFDPYRRGYKPTAMWRCYTRAQISRLTGGDQCGL